VALTADEEGGKLQRLEWLVKHQRDWIDAEYCINWTAWLNPRKAGLSLFNIDVSERST